MASMIKMKQINWSDNYNENLLEQNKEFKILKRQMKLYELSLSAVEKENELLKKELKDIKKMLCKK